MSQIALISLIVCGLSLIAHAASALLAWRRCKLGAHEAGWRRHPRPGSANAVSILRPVCGLDQHDVATLRSSFHLAHSKYEVIFCSATAMDPAVAAVKRLIAEYPDVDARLLIGDDRESANPKLNNLVKGWQAARHDWIVLADSNVLLPPDYVDRLFEAWRDGTGLVCAPPAGSRPDGLWAEVECAFLNTYQARWQYAADSIGLGFAQGKSMLWQRQTLDRAGGILALSREIAEDAAATKIVRESGLNVRLASPPSEQPLGRRSLATVWKRQMRWARLRRATFPLYFLPEILTGSVPAVVCGAIAASQLDAPPTAAIMTLAAFWYGTEAALAKTCGWPCTAKSLVASLLRDLALPVLWCSAWLGDDFDWRGNAMSVSATSGETASTPPILREA